MKWKALPTESGNGEGHRHGKKLERSANVMLGKLVCSPRRHSQEEGTTCGGAGKGKGSKAMVETWGVGTGTGEVSSRAGSAMVI